MEKCADFKWIALNAAVFDFWHLVCNREGNHWKQGAPMKAYTTETQRAFGRGITATFLSLALALMAGCGGGGGGSSPAAVNTVSGSPSAQGAASSFTLTSDSYGMENSTYLSASKSSLGIVLRSSIASSMTDPNFKPVIRIDIAPSASIAPSAVYSLGAATATTPAFPGSVYFFNTHQSTLLKTVGGTITFTSYGSNSGDRISGSFSAVIEDGNDPSQANYTVAANFDFVTDSYGPVLPAPASLALAAQGSYDANCASCHALGSHDPTAGSASDLALKGGRMNGIFSADLPSHQGIRLATGEINALKVLLNTN